MYYLNSRFYDAEIGRFFNADNIDLLLDYQTTLIDKNLYAYCDNNPTNRMDENGKSWICVAIGGGIAGGIIAAMSYLCTSTMNEEEFSWGKFLGTTTVGVVNGAMGSVAGVASGLLKICLTIAPMAISGVYTRVTTETDNSAYKSRMGELSATHTLIGTLAGMVIDTSVLKGFGAIFGNCVITFGAGTLTEISNIATQQKTTKTYNTSETDSMYHNTYGSGGGRVNVCALY